MVWGSGIGYEARGKTGKSHLLISKGTQQNWKYQREVMKVDDTKEDLYFEGFNPADLQKILDTQKRVVEFQKKNKEKKHIQYLYLC